MRTRPEYEALIPAGITIRDDTYASALKFSRPGYWATTGQIDGAGGYGSAGYWISILGFTLVSTFYIPNIGATPSVNIY